MKEIIIHNNPANNQKYSRYVSIAAMGLKPGDTITINSDIDIQSILYYKEDRIVISSTTHNTNTFTTTISSNSATFYIRFRFPDKTDNLPSYMTINGTEYRLIFGENGIIESFEDELDYIKQSFEMRFPDEDDVPEGWGFMGIDSKTMMIDVHLFYNGQNTTQISYDYFNTDSITVSFDNNALFGITTTGGESRYNLPNGTTVSLQGASDFYLSSDDNNWTYVDINGVRYYKGEIINDGSHTSPKNPYESNAISDNSFGLKALIDWVDGCTDEEFVRDFEQHFHKDYTFRYYLLVITLG